MSESARVSKALLGDYSADWRKRKPLVGMGLEHMNGPRTELPTSLDHAAPRSAGFQVRHASRWHWLPFILSDDCSGCPSLSGRFRRWRQRAVEVQTTERQRLAIRLPVCQPGDHCCARWICTHRVAGGVPTRCCGPLIENLLAWNILSIGEPTYRKATRWDGSRRPVWHPATRDFCTRRILCSGHLSCCLYTVELCGAYT